MVAGNNEQVYFLQPETDGANVIRAIKSDGQIIDTQLTAANISRHLNKPQLRGTIRAMTAIPGGKILLYYAGTDSSESLASLLVYNTDNGELQTIVNTTELAEQTGLGILLDIAEVQIVFTGEAFWFWFSHVDANVFLRIDARDMQNIKPKLQRSFDKLYTDEGPLKITSRDTLFGDYAGGLWLIRENSNSLLRLSTTGQAFPERNQKNRNFSPLPPIALSERNQQNQPLMLHFYPTDDLRTPDEAIQLIDNQKLAYPVFEVTGGKQDVIIDRNRFIIRSGFPLHALRLSNWLPVPNSNDLISYDAMSGEIFRIIFRFE